MSLPAAACVGAAVAYAVGAVLQSVAARRGKSGLHGLATIFRQGPYLAGLTCDLVGWLLALYAINHLPLFAVYATLAGSVAITIVLAWLVFDAPLRRYDGIAIVAVVVGLVLVGLAADPTPGTTGTAIASKVLLIGVPITTILAVVALGRSEPFVSAAVSGLLFSLGAATTRTIDLDRSLSGLVAQPTAWAVVIYLGGGLIVHAHALRVGSVGAVMAGLWVTEIVVAAMVGFLLFGDQARPGTLPWAIIGTAVALGATTRLALNYTEPTVDLRLEHVTPAPE